MNRLDGMNGSVSKQAGAAFQEKLARALRSYAAPERFLVGVSGGRDSVALLHGLLQAGFRRLVVCHLDHGLRGAAARADARFVARTAEKLGLPVETDRVDVPALAREQKLSPETAAREARHRFFARVSRRRRCGSLFLAHQADDQVETFLFNLLRGAGTSGLGAMRVESERVVGAHKLRIIRPLLAIWREEVDGYLQESKLRWREDATNADPTHATRNRLRLEVIPLLGRAMGREVKPALWRAADLLGAEDEWLDVLTQAAPPPPTQIPVDVLAARPVAQQRRTVLAWLREQGVSGVGYREVEAVRTLLDKEEGPAKINLPGNRHARRRGGVLFVE